MRPVLQIRQNQQLTMTPQLQLAIRVLKLSTFELEQLIQNEVSKNPLLDNEPHLLGNETHLFGKESHSLSTESQLLGKDFHSLGIESQLLGKESHSLGIESHLLDKESRLLDNNSFFDPSAKTSIDAMTVEILHDSFSLNSNELSRKAVLSFNDKQELFSNIAETNSLKTHLLWQMNLSHLSVKKQVIAMILIDAIDENGYLRQSEQEIHECLIMQGQNDIEPNDIESTLSIIQQCDPAGIGARNLSECLNLQLNTWPSITPWLEQTKALVLNYLDLLAKRDFSQLKSRLKLSQHGLNEVIKLIKRLDPKPGLKILCRKPEYRMPDVIVRNQNNHLTVELNMANLPKLCMNTQYATHIKQASKTQEIMQLRHYITEAEWLLKSIHNRNDTLLKVAKCIVEKQRGFFKEGEKALKPLKLQEIAGELSLHESTISRIIDQKYLDTERGIVELKYFFSNALLSKEGNHCSSTAIRALIKKMIAEEAKTEPLSDHQITSLLSQQGILLSRRTVSKYRMAMKILSAQDRRRSYRS